MEVTADGERLAADLGRWLAEVTFVDLDTDQVTALVIDSVARWAEARGWRVYRRAPSVLPLPPPLEQRQSVLDVACARPDGPPVVVEVDHTDRARTVRKLLAEADAGRIPLWVRWGVGRFTEPGPPVRMVTVEVTRRAGPAGRGRLHSRVGERPAPAHSAGGGTLAAQALPIPMTEPSEAVEDAGKGT
ncbi:hypothetical protein O7634_27465 [Micromonospora sp. WMMD1120]|uniref:hypothetical protein n=1 Tax=Micromonospora sp. WMMD1120 TaxID=3016106 RepID=UPI0024171E71|nr:hypothetical protein [Micromonospora sp. WMMD1120]MDG4810510.1 hypothetical protein [Micromonospora sp. WMMD1120]